METAYGYGRFSTNRQREESIEAQEIAIKNYCEQHNIKLVRFFADRGLSGTNDDREEFQEMLKEADKGKVDYVIIHKLDRFARNRYDSAIVRKRLADHGIKLISVLEHFDEDSPEDVILMSVLEGMAEYYSKNLSREVKKGMYRNVEKGKYNGGFLPYGYESDKENHMIVINEYEASIVRDVYNMYLDNYGYVAISKELNKRGLKTKRGNAWTADTVNKLLRNEKYKGVYSHGKTHVTRYGGHQKVTKNKEWKSENTYPVIIDEITWNAAHAKRQQMKPRVGVKERYLLVGYAKCAKCSRNYIGSSTTNFVHNQCYRYRFYTCSGHNRKKCDAKIIRADLLEDIVIDYIEEVFFNEKSLNQYLDDLTNALSQEHNDKEQLKNIKQQIKSMMSKKDRLVDLYIADSITKSIYDQKISEIDYQLSKLYEAEKSLNNKPVNLSKKDVKKIIMKIMKERKNNEIYRKTLINCFLKDIVISDEKVEITLKNGLISDIEAYLCNIDSISPYSSKKAFTASPPLQID